MYTRRKYIIGFVLIVAALFTSATALAGSTRLNITKKLGGIVGSVFTLDGQLRVRTLFVRDSLDAKYDNSTSGLSAKTYKGAIDELGISVKKLISGSSLKATSVSASSTLKSTTWKGYGYVYTVDPLTNGLVKKTQQISITFNPATDTTGTFTTTPLYAFSISGDHLYDSGHSGNTCGTPLSGYSFGSGNYPTGTFSGNYELVSNYKVWTFPIASDHATCIVPPAGVVNSYSHPTSIDVKGTTLTLSNSDGTQVILERQ